MAIHIVPIYLIKQIIYKWFNLVTVATTIGGEIFRGLIANHIAMFMVIYKVHHLSTLST